MLQPTTHTSREHLWKTPHRACGPLPGARVVGEVEEHEYGRFGWFVDPDGNKVELWELPSRRREG